MFRRKYEFKPDRTDSGILNKLHLTKRQRLLLLKWVLTGLFLVLLSLVQDTMLSRVSIYGATFDLLACGILLGCMFFDPDTAAVYLLVSSAFYYFSGTAPGVYIIAVLTFLGVMLCIFRRSYLRRSFSSTFLCTVFGLIVYKLLVFVIGLFLGSTTWDRYLIFAISAGLSIAVIPLFYPIFLAIRNFGGETWKE